MNYYCEHNISPLEMRLPEGTDTIHITRNLNLNQVADVCKINIDELRSLNPEFKKDIIPLSTEPYALRLPNSIISRFLETKIPFTTINRNLPDPPCHGQSGNTKHVRQKGKSGKAVYYRIRQGDTLGGIAAKYGVSVSQLRRLNGLRGNNIRAGKSLRIR